MPTLRIYVRPDGRRFVRDPDAASLVETKSDVYCTVDASEVDSYLALGFDVHRCERTYVVPTSSAHAAAPAGIVFVSVDKVGEVSLRLLDDELRQDVPGTDGWRWDEAAFREETYDAPEFDPTTYLVALEEATGRHIGIVRVWMKQPTPRLGFIGVLPSHRRQGVGRALLAAVFARLVERGFHEVSTEIDETNTASRALLEGLGARLTGASVELIRRYDASAESSGHYASTAQASQNTPVAVRPSVPDDAEAIAAIQVSSFQVGLLDVHPAEALATLDPTVRIRLWREREALVAEDESGIVGVAEVGLSNEERVGEVYRLFVAPERWGEGVGQALMAHALGQLRASGVMVALLWVHADNRRARRFYESGGWQLDGAEKNQEAFGRPVRLVRYRITLR